MKITLIILSSILLFPLVSSAAGTVRPPVEAKITRPLEVMPGAPGVRIIDPAYKPPALIMESESCGPTCALQVEGILTRTTIRAANRTAARGPEAAETIGTVFNIIPAIGAALGKKGAKPEVIVETQNAVAGAGIRAKQENWDTETIANVVQFAKDLAANPNAADPAKLEALREDCVL